MIYRTTALALTLFLAACVAAPQRSAADSATAQLTRQPYAIRVMLGQQDLTQRLGVVRVRYMSDGSIDRTLADGRHAKATWRFLDTTAQSVETVGPEGTARWQVLELTEASFRKRNVENGMEIIHTSAP
jgi:hypothetical protein